jgi:hypothetical protein
MPKITGKLELLVVPYYRTKGIIDANTGNIRYVKLSGGARPGPKQPVVPNVFYKQIQVIRKTGLSNKEWATKKQSIAKRIINNLQSEYDGESSSESFSIISSAGKAFSFSGVSAGVKMRRAKPYNYDGVYSVANDGNCVPETLQKLYPKMKMTKIIELLGYESDGYTPEQVLKFCKAKDITCIGINNYNEILVSYVSTDHHYKNKPLYFMAHDSHMYLMDTDMKNHFAKSRQNKKTTLYESDKKEKTIVYDAEIKYDAENTHFILSSVGEVQAEIMKYIWETNTMPKISAQATSDNSTTLTGFSFGSNKVSANPHFELVQKLQAKGFEGKTINEVAASMAKRFIGEVPKSNMNQIIFDLFKEFHPTQHYAQLYDKNEWSKIDGHEDALDVNKQYSSILRNSQFPWCMYNNFSMPQPYSGKIQDGFYFIETENTCPCRGNSWYSRAIAEWLQKNNVAHKIIYELIPSKTLPHDFFTEFVDSVIAETSDFKHVINNFIGSLNKNRKPSTSVKVYADQIDAFADVWNRGSNYNEIELDEELKVYTAIKIDSHDLFQNNMPMNAQIIDLAAIQLADAIKHLESKGAVIRGYKADSITFKHKDKLEIDLPTSSLGGWKHEAVKELKGKVAPRKCEKKYIYNPRWNSVIYESMIMNKDHWIDSESGLVEATSAVDYIIDFASRESCMLSGEAGFGKSYILGKVIEKVGASKVLTLAFTNMAANNVDGGTFHKSLKIAINETEPKWNLADVLADKELMIIDEISMVPSYLYHYIESAIKMGVRVILSGDFAQLNPVAEIGLNVESDLLKILCKNLIVLTEYKRGTHELLNALRSVRTRKEVPFPKGEHGDLHFVFTQKQRDKINNREMAKHDGIMTGNSNVPKVYVGMPLRCCVTKDDGSLLNGERFVITDIDTLEIKSVTRENEQFIDDLDNFMPGYAITVHASQGLTISENYTVWISDKTAFSEDEVWRLIYTACSRAKKLDQIRVVYY